MNYTQSNCTDRDIVVEASEAIAAGRLVKIANSSGSPVAALPTDVADYAAYVALDAAAAAGDGIPLRPVTLGRQVRVTLKSTCVPGDILTLADPGTAADKGKVRVLPAGADTYFIVGIAEESGVDGQSVLIRPCTLGTRVVT